MQFAVARQSIPPPPGGRLLAPIAVLALLLAACSIGNDPDPTAPPAARSPSATPAPTATQEPEPTATEAFSWWMMHRLPPDLNAPPDPPTPTPVPPEALGPDGLFEEIQISRQGNPHLIPLDQIQNGGVAKDGIPAIDEPQFATREEWDALDYDPEGLVISVEVDGIRRAYPFQILVWHELVNDTINGKPLLISYCPLCGSAIVFERVLSDAGPDREPLGEVEFGVSGLLYNSDLLMYDRATDSLWSQILGVAVFGELTGARLAFYPSEIMAWHDWRAAYPDAEVLTRDTGSHARNYDRDPYGDYGLTPEIWFPTNQTSGNFDALYPKRSVTGVGVPLRQRHPPQRVLGRLSGPDGQVYGAYSDRDVAEHGPVNDTLGDTPLLVAADPTAGNNVVVFLRAVDGRELTFQTDGDSLIDEQTGSRWTYDGLAVEGELAGTRLTEIIPIKSFWFAWVAFHPDTEVWQPE